MWTYEQTTGRLLDPTDEVAGIGYSGKGAGKNNPAMENVPRVGPIPCGDYMVGASFDSPEKGKLVLPLTPLPTNKMYGRADFEMHGDSIPHPGEASEGCVIQSHSVRARVDASSDRLVRVISALMPIDPEI